MLNMDNQQSTHHFACEENAEGMWQCVCENCCIWICACAASTFCCVSFKCVFLFPSVSCSGFIPAMAFNRREHQSTRLTFNPKPGQVEKHTCMHIACTYMYIQKKQTHTQTHYQLLFYTYRNINQNPRMNLWTTEHCGSCRAMRGCELNY